MASQKYKHYLEHFQNFGDTNSLLDFIKLSGRNLHNYQESVNILSPVFKGLTFGEKPSFEYIDKNALQQFMVEIVDIVMWMADSPKADMKTAALELMGLLGWKTFKTNLRKSLVSEFKWERLTAIKALGKIKKKWAAELLKVFIKDPDPEVRNAIHRTLKKIL